MANSDITYCVNGRCPLKGECARSYSKDSRPKAGFIAVDIFFPKGKECNMMIRKEKR